MIKMYEYNYDILKSDLSMGIERDFSYKDYDVGINNWIEGWQFSWRKRDTNESYASKYYTDISDLLKDARIEGKTIEEIFKEDEQGANNIQIDFYAPPPE